MKPLSTDLFAWDPKSRTFSVERTSVLRHGKKQVPPYQISLNPSPPRTLALVSARTGETKVFAYAGPVWCEGELTGWRWSADGITVYVANGDVFDGNPDDLY